MSGDAASPTLDVRRLCQKAKFVAPAVAAATSPHLLGLGIKNNHKYKIGSAVARLPKSEAGLAHLREAVKQPIDLLSEAYREPAWRALLVAPTLLVELPSDDPGAVALRYDVQDVATVSPSRLRVLALATVIHPPRILRTNEGVVEEVPVAGIGQLVLMSDSGRQDVYVRAWPRVTWTTETRILCRGLEDIHLTLKQAARVERLKNALLLAPEDGTVTNSRLAACAAVLGFRLNILRGTSISSEALASVRRAPPSAMLVGRSVERDSLAAMEAARAAGRAPVVLSDNSPDLLLEEVRHRLIREARVTPALMCMTADREPVDSYRYVMQAPLPIKERGQRVKNRRSGYTYTEDRTDGFWYTRDHSNHSSQQEQQPVAFKRYIASSSGLEWNADLDQSGNPIQNKHKGATYLNIPWQDLDVCAGSSKT